MAPIVYQYRVPCFVPISTGGAMNKQRTCDSIRVLERVVAVIPRMTVLHCLKVVCVGIVRSNGTLRNTVDPISFIRMKLTNAMPMDGSPIVGQIVGNVNSLGRLLVNSFLPKDQQKSQDQNSEHRAPTKHFKPLP